MFPAVSSCRSPGCRLQPWTESQIMLGYLGRGRPFVLVPESNPYVVFTCWSQDICGDGHGEFVDARRWGETPGLISPSHGHNQPDESKEETKTMVVDKPMTSACSPRIESSRRCRSQAGWLQAYFAPLRWLAARCNVMAS